MGQREAHGRESGMETVLIVLFVLWLLDII